MAVKRSVGGSPLTKVEANTIVPSTGTHPAVFFEINLLTAWLTEEAVAGYVQRGEALPPGPLKPEEMCVIPTVNGLVNTNAITYLKEYQDKGYILIAVSMEDHVGYLAKTQGVKEGAIALSNAVGIHEKMLDILRMEGVFITELLYCAHGTEIREIMGPDPANPLQQRVIDRKHYVTCPCHFPKRGLIRAAIARHDIDICKSIMVWRDEAAKNMAVDLPGVPHFKETCHADRVMDGTWRPVEADKLHRELAEAMKKDIQRGSSGGMEALAANEFGLSTGDKAIEEAMPNVTNVLHKEGLLEHKE